MNGPGWPDEERVGHKLCFLCLKKKTLFSYMKFFFLLKPPHFTSESLGTFWLENCLAVRTYFSIKRKNILICEHFEIKGITSASGV